MCSASGVNAARKELFAQGSRTMENIPPTLLQHVRRAAYQGHVLPSPVLWGWLKSDSGRNPFGLNYQRRSLHATNLYTADARRAAGISANAVRRIYSAHNSANVAEHVATTCSG